MCDEVLGDVCAVVLVEVYAGSFWLMRVRGKEWIHAKCLCC